MRCSKTCFLIFASLIMMTGGFVLTLSGWSVPPIREAVYRVRMAGPLILLIGFFLLLSACGLCAYNQKRCCLCCYMSEKRKNVYPGPDYPFAEHMVEIASPQLMGAQFDYQYEGPGKNPGKSESSPELVWHKKDSLNLRGVDDHQSASQIKPLLYQDNLDAKSQYDLMLKGCRVQLKATREIIAETQSDYFTSGDPDGPIITASDQKLEPQTLNQPYHDLYSSSITSQCKTTVSDTDTITYPRTHPETSQRQPDHTSLKGILKTQSLDRKPRSSPNRKMLPDSSSTSELPGLESGSLKRNGLKKNAKFFPTNVRPRPLSQTDHTTCPIVSTPPASARKQVIVLPRPGSYRDMASRTRPSPDRSPLLGLPKGKAARSMATSVV